MKQSSAPKPRSRKRPQPQQRPPATRPAGAACLFLGILSALVFLDYLPWPVLALYAAASLLTFVVYAADKAAARAQRWRISEDSLHLLALIGGWPGALLAQAMLRHKSSKAAFRQVFWTTLVLNVAVLGWLLSPAGAPLLRAIFAVAR